MAKKKTTPRKTTPRKSATAEPARDVHVFKVALIGMPQVWRRIEIKADQTLHDLHEMIFEAFDRYDEHMYAFSLAAPGARTRKAFREAEQYLHPFAFDDVEERCHDAAETRVRDLNLRQGRKLMYEFDFGDQWMHEVTFERVLPRERGAGYPRIVERHGESPPQYPDFDEEE